MGEVSIKREIIGMSIFTLFWVRRRWARITV